MALLASLVWAGCSCGKKTTSVLETGTCAVDDDCTAGERCIKGICQAPEEGEVEGEPDISVDPGDCDGADGDLCIDFGSPLLETPTEVSITITNVGDAPLTVTNLVVDGDTAPQDFHVAKNPAVPFTLAAGVSAEIFVTLLWVDVEPPVATLVIASDDADEPTVDVFLLSEWKGEPCLDVCALRGDSTNPFKTMPPCVELSELGTDHEDDVVDFGTLLYDTTATRLVAVSNCADGNAVLHLSAASVTNEEQFDIVDIFRIDDAGAEIPVSLEGGRDLNPRDVSTLPEVLYLRLEMHGLEPGNVDESLVLTSDDESGDTLEVPLRAVVSCEDGFVDVDGLDANGCECGPVAEEVCNGEDDDCDGEDDDGLLLGQACDGLGDEDECAEGWLICADDGTVECEDLTGEALDLCATPELWIRAHVPGGGGVVQAGSAMLAGAIGLEGPAGRVTSGGMTLTSGFWHVLP